jgi:hypothetical protein
LKCPQYVVSVSRSVAVLVDRFLHSLCPPKRVQPREYVLLSSTIIHRWSGCMTIDLGSFLWQRQIIFSFSMSRIDRSMSLSAPRWLEISLAIRPEQFS